MRRGAVHLSAASIVEKLRGVDVLFSAFGTTRALAGSDGAFRRKIKKNVFRDRTQRNERRELVVGKKKVKVKIAAGSLRHPACR